MLLIIEEGSYFSDSKKVWSLVLLLAKMRSVRIEKKISLDCMYVLVLQRTKYFILCWLQKSFYLCCNPHGKSGPYIQIHVFSKGIVWPCQNETNKTLKTVPTLLKFFYLWKKSISDANTKLSPQMKILTNKTVKPLECSFYRVQSWDFVFPA